MGLLTSVKNKFWRLDKQHKKVWHLALLCLFWCIKREYNDHVFNEEEHQDQNLKEIFIKSLRQWSSVLLDL